MCDVVVSEGNRAPEALTLLSHFTLHSSDTPPRCYSLTRGRLPLLGKSGGSFHMTGRECTPSNELPCAQHIPSLDNLAIPPTKYLLSSSHPRPPTRAFFQTNNPTVHLTFTPPNTNQNDDLDRRPRPEALPPFHQARQGRQQDHCR